MNSLVKHASWGAVFLGSISGLHAAPAVTLGEDNVLFLNSSIALEHQSNVARSDDEISDTILVVTPGVEFRMGDDATNVAHMNLGYEIRQHFEEDDLNGEFLRFGFAHLFDNDLLVLKSHVGYNEYGTNARQFDSTITDELVLAERADSVAGAEARYRVTEQAAVGAAIEFEQRDWDDESQLTGYESLGIPIRVFFAIAPELDAFIGYRHREVAAYDPPAQLEGSLPSYTDNYYFAGLEGQIFNPLWTVNLDVGWQERDFDLPGNPVVGQSSNDDLTFSARVNYAADANRNYYAVLARDFGQSASRAVSFERTRFTIGGDYRVTEMWSTVFGLTWATSDYGVDPLVPQNSDRSQDILIGKLGVNYIPNEYVTFTGSYQYNDIDSEGFTNDGYRNHIITVSAAVRY